MEQARGTSQLPTLSIIYGLENTYIIHACIDRFADNKYTISPKLARGNWKL